ncbi:MAG TPA: IMP cyclohydrolase [Myxococcota bacterium]|nr:IMP cyclohydrolase [Myxococcota bacterium]HRY94954.1 IMP cyclohydrolase [Myxococcota bacterium]HSA19983.1 IMP cyclohydrolase [Myxococcota bacterium]
MAQDLKAAYRTIVDEHFPERLEIAYVWEERRELLVYEKVRWDVEGERRGLRYGENPGQPAALYRLVNGNLVVGDVRVVGPGQGLVTDATLHQFGKHPGKINLTDADNALNILRYLTDRPACAIMKHNNPSGVALAERLVDAYLRAEAADRVAAFGGCIALNRPVDRETAEAISARYAEVVVAPGFEAGAVEALARRKNLRIMEIRRMARLAELAPQRFVDVKSLLDGGLVLQLSYVPEARRPEDFRTAEVVHKGQTYRVAREPSPRERVDMAFGWVVEAGVSSNSVLYVKDGVTVGIGTGEQDRVGVAEIARDKAYRKLADHLCFERHQKPYHEMADLEARAAVDAEVRAAHGGLEGAVMISDGFFPFRDGLEVGLREGVRAVVQPGGSLNDHEVIQACNQFGAAMAFTGQRSFRH